MMGTLNFLVVTMVFHTYLAYEVSKSKKEIASHFGNSILFHKRKSPMNPITDDNDKEIMNSQMIQAKRFNTIAKIAFPIFGILANIAFWYVAITEYLRPANEYIKSYAIMKS